MEVICVLPRTQKVAMCTRCSVPESAMCSRCSVPESQLRRRPGATPSGALLPLPVWDHAQTCIPKIGHDKNSLTFRISEMPSGRSHGENSEGKKQVDDYIVKPP